MTWTPADELSIYKQECERLAGLLKQADALVAKAQRRILEPLGAAEQTMMMNSLRKLVLRDDSEPGAKKPPPRQAGAARG